MDLVRQFSAESVNSKQNHLRIEHKVWKYIWLESKENFYGKIYYEFNGDINIRWIWDEYGWYWW